MKFIADFHLHSHYSIATSKELTPPYLDHWARLKGITVIGTGDFTHPGWTAELKDHLEPAEPGLFKLKKEFQDNPPDLDPSLGPKNEVRFLLTCEISSIYKKKGRVRKVHQLIFAPSFDVVDKIQKKLTAMGANITSDGRPIIGMDSRNLLEMALDASETIFFVPAHIWTPWFSVLGSKSGFDRIEECFDDLAPHIHAVETGLSTDPPINWMCSFLDRYTLIANSDAHSPEKLGRNATCFNTELSYDAIVQAMKTGDRSLFGGSIHLFPQEGKYHYDGHRKCHICWDPLQTLKHDGICSQCGKPVTVGVMNRIAQLSDREDLNLRKNRHPFHSIIPLKEILAELAGTKPLSRKVDAAYLDLLKHGVSELEILLNTPVSDLRAMGGEALAEAVRRMRNREVYIREGYDGEYGVIKVFAEGENPGWESGNALFKDTGTNTVKRQVPPPRQMINFDLEEYRQLFQENARRLNEAQNQIDGGNNGTGSGDSELNPIQHQAASHFTGPSLVLAGPGTGKTRVLVTRISHLVTHRGISPDHILAITFTNKAAGEIRERLDIPVRVTTFHALGYTILQEQSRNPNGVRSILEPDDRKRILQRLAACSAAQASTMATAIEAAKQQLKGPEEVDDPAISSIYLAYQRYLKDRQIVDLDDLLIEPVKLLETCPDVLSEYRQRFQWVLIDEYQDINFAQYRLIRLLMADRGSNLCAIGDPDQAIYGFRGADIHYIRKFQDDYPDAAIYRLNQSYRCSDSILNASANVLQRDTVLSGIGKGVKIKIVKHPTHKSEAEFVARTIEDMMGGLRFFSMDSDITQGHNENEIESLSDFVVLYRMKDQVDALEKALTDHSIPYQVIGEEPFFKKEPVSSILDLLKLAVHPENEMLKERVIEKGILKEPDLSEFASFIETLRETEAVALMIRMLVERYFGSVSETHKDALDRLLRMAEEEGRNADRFLQSVALGTSADTYHRDLERVTLMTLHAAKGLEFKTVFIVGCEEGILPVGLFKNQQTDRDEERRLLYVGMTRAKKFLYLSHAERRFIMGKEYRLPKSSFLVTIEKKWAEWSEQEKKKTESGPVQRKLFD